MLPRCVGLLLRARHHRPFRRKMIVFATFTHMLRNVHKCAKALSATRKDGCEAEDILRHRNRCHQVDRHGYQPAESQILIKIQRFFCNSVGESAHLLALHNYWYPTVLAFETMSAEMFFVSKCHLMKPAIFITHWVVCTCFMVAMRYRQLRFRMRRKLKPSKHNFNPFLLLLFHLFPFMFFKINSHNLCFQFKWSAWTTIN